MESSSICGGWWTFPAAVRGGNPAFDPVTLSAAVCQDFLERNRMFTGLISYSEDNMVPWLEKENMHWIKVILVSYFARKNNDLFWYGCGHSIGNSIKPFLRCSFPGGFPKMKLHTQWSCVLCPAVKAYGHLTSCIRVADLVTSEQLLCLILVTFGGFRETRQDENFVQILGDFNGNANGIKILLFIFIHTIKCMHVELDDPWGPF